MIHKERIFRLPTMAGLIFSIILAASFLPGLQAGERPVQEKGIVPVKAEVECLFDGGFFLEGPAVAPDGKVYFSDITFSESSGMQAGHIWCYDPVTGRTHIFRSPSGMANGIAFDDSGRMVIAEGADFGGRRITRTNMNTGKSVILTGLYQNKPYNSPNDLVIDSAGRIYFTDPRYVGHESIDQPVTGVYRLENDGQVTLLIKDIPNPNGIGLSPDEKILYVACFNEGETDPGKICRSVYEYDVAADGDLKFKSQLIDVSPGWGVDGIAVDFQGNIYVTCTPPHGIKIFNPEGEPIGLIPVPEMPSNLTFGHGDTRDRLYITAGKCLYTVRINSQGVPRKK